MRLAKQVYRAILAPVELGWLEMPEALGHLEEAYGRLSEEQRHVFWQLVNGGDVIQAARLVGGRDYPAVKRLSDFVRSIDPLFYPANLVLRIDPHYVTLAGLLELAGDHRPTITRYLNAVIAPPFESLPEDHRLAFVRLAQRLEEASQGR